mgnify:CR=1 FL=1
MKDYSKEKVIDALLTIYSVTVGCTFQEAYELMYSALEGEALEELKLRLRVIEGCLR